MKKTFQKLFSGAAIKILILLLIFLAVAAFYFLFDKEEEKVDSEKMGDPAIPVVYMTFEDRKINELHGYVGNMDTALMRDTITPLPDSYDLKIKIENYGNPVKKISFKILDPDGSNLVQQTEVAEWETLENEADAVLRIDEMVEKDQEYILVLSVETETHDSIKYYTRLLYQSDAYIREHIAFVESFSAMTLDKTRSEELIKYLEPDVTQNDNSDFGLVTIHSNYHQVSWGSMAPERITEPVLSISEMFGNIASLQLGYLVRAGERTYSVREYFRVNIANGTEYLLDYERQTQEIFKPSEGNVSKRGIVLGIDRDLSAEYASDEDGLFVAFENSGTLWCMNTDLNTMTPVFTFRKDDNQAVRENFEQYGIKIIQVENTGRITFLVYGYMNRGAHEGKTGLSICMYDPQKGITQEKSFIESERPYAVINQIIGELQYISQDETLYLLLDDSLYSIDLTGEESVRITDGLAEGNYTVSYDGSRIAWHTDSEINSAREITVLDLKTASPLSVSAPQNSYIRALGFLGEGFVYGLAAMDDLVMNSGQNGTLYLNEIRVIDRDGQETLRKKDEGVYYTWSENEYNRISLGRSVRSGDVFTEASEYAIYDTSQEEKKETELALSTDAVRKKELSLLFEAAVIKAGAVKSDEMGTFIFKEPAGFSLETITDKLERYYVFGKGTLQGIFIQPSAAVRKADELAGVVLDGTQDYFWIRGIRRTSVTLTEADLLNAKGSLSQPKKIVNLSGCTLDQVLYFISQGKCILAETGPVRYLIYGYDSSKIKVMDIQTEARQEINIAEAGVFFAASGNQFQLIQ